MKGIFSVGSVYIYTYMKNEIFLCNILSIRNKYIENLKIQLRTLPFQSSGYDIMACVLWTPVSFSLTNLLPHRHWAAWALLGCGLILQLIVAQSSIYLIIFLSSTLLLI